MATVKDLTVRISYRVTLCDVEMPNDVYDQIHEANENGNDIHLGGVSEYPEALQWLMDNIREGDCIDWEAEIEDFI